MWKECYKALDDVQTIIKLRKENKKKEFQLSIFYYYMAEIFLKE